MFYACDVCDKKFKKDQLNTHVSTHQDSIDICYACGITFTQKNNWTTPMKIYHLPQNFKCNHCPKSFIDKKALKNLLLHVQVFQQPAIKACLFWTTKIHTFGPDSNANVEGGHWFWVCCVLLCVVCVLLSV